MENQQTPEGKIEALRNSICQARDYTDGKNNHIVYQDLLEDNDYQSALSVTDEVLSMVILENSHHQEANAKLVEVLRRFVDAYREGLCSVVDPVYLDSVELLQTYETK